MTVLVVMAMRAEAAPVVDALGLDLIERSAMWPQLEWSSNEDKSVVVATNGVDPIHGVDAIGTDSAAIASLLSIERWNPQWVVSAGTAGGFLERNGVIGQVVLADGPIIHHDRRIPLRLFESYGPGYFATADLRSLGAGLGFALGPCSSGNSLDASELDLVAMRRHGTLAKDMEAAAVAGIAARLGRQFTALKVITDLVDGPLTTADEFQANIELASAVLADAVPNLVERLDTIDAA